MNEILPLGLSKNKLIEMIKEFGVPGNPRSLAALLKSEQDDKSYEHQCHNWINQLYTQGIKIEEMRDTCGNLLERSELLTRCATEQERETMIHHFSTFLNILEDHLAAKKMIDNEKGEEFIDSLLEKLRCSSFIYHPRRNFNILQALFLRKPELLDSRIPELLEIIAHRDISLWRMEPVRTSLVKLMEFYLTVMEQRIDHTQEKGETLTNTTRTLACQLELMRNGEETLSDVADLQLNCVRLYIMASFAEHLAGNTLLLDKALQALTGEVDIPPTHSLYRANDEALPAMLIEHARNSENRTTKSVAFERNGVKVKISDEGIQLLGLGIDRPSQGKAVVPSHLTLEHNMQLFLAKRPPITFGKNREHIPLYEKLWDQTEELLYNQEKGGIRMGSGQQHHHVGERVEIYVVRKETKERFRCQIKDEIGGEGYILLTDIVQYHFPPQLSLFQSIETGRPYVMLADIVEVDDEGMFHFSMMDVVRELIAGANFNADEVLTCSLGGDYHDGAQWLPAVCDEGFGVSVIGLDQAPDDLRRGDLVKVRYVGPGQGTFHISAEFVERIEEEEVDFNLSDAFHTLLDNFISEDVLDTVEVEEENLMEKLGVERMLNLTEMKQLIRIVDRYATIENNRNPLLAYNYLGFARVLSLLIGWEEQARYYKGLMNMIKLLYDFALNDKVDAEKLSKVVEENMELLGHSTFLLERFLQIQILAYIDKADINEKLWEATRAENPRVKNLAELVLTYNLLKEHDMETQARDVLNSIKAVMSLKNCESGLKKYGLGIETDTMEYKSSIVYFAREPKPNVKKQGDVILNVIASFLNHKGGTLCIGVNDQGMGVGLSEDLSLPMFGHDRGKYVNYLSQLISSNFGPLIAPYVSVGFDTENTDKDICLVRVKPYAKGCVRHNAEGKEVWYVRLDAHKEAMNKEAFDAFNLQMRRELLEEQAAELIVEAEASAPSAQKAEPEVVEEVMEAKLPTSKLRLNVLNDYEEGYRPTIAYLQIREGGILVKSTDKAYAQALLDLAVYEEESTGYLMLGYANGLVVKVPMEEVLRFEDYSEHRLCTDSELLFASIASGSDYWLSVLKPTSRVKAEGAVRLDSLENIEKGHLSDKGVALCNADLYHEAVCYEVVPAAKALALRELKDQKPSTAGIPLTKLKKTSASVLAGWGV